MTVKVLQHRTEIQHARNELLRRDISALSGSGLMDRILNRLRLKKPVPVGNFLKSWDVLLTADFIKDRLPAAAPILDMGACFSEILCVLHRMKYTALTGIDLNPAVAGMPYAKKIRYEVGDLMRTPFADKSFAAVTAVSVIEHGFQSGALLKELARLLRPGGYFIASFDYWPKKIDTSGCKLFDMDWRIFSSEEVLAFIEEAKSCGFSPCGPVELAADEALIETVGKSYTFAWLVLQKTA